MNAEIITIGDEILIGQIVDTNSAYIAQELNKIGVSVYQITSVQDDKSHILKALNEAEVNAGYCHCNLADWDILKMILLKRLFVIILEILW